MYSRQPCLSPTPSRIGEAAAGVYESVLWLFEGSSSRSNNSKLRAESMAHSTPDARQTRHHASMQKILVFLDD